MLDRRTRAPHASAVAGLGLALCLTLAPQGATADPESWSIGRHLLTSPRLLGDPGGARSDLREAGVALQLFFNTTFGAVPSGGAGAGDRYRNSGSYDLFAYADAEELGWLEGLSLLLHAKGNYGRNINPRVGALSDPIDDADFDEPIYLVQLWAQQDLFSDRVRLRAGYQDEQTVLDRNAFANSEDIQFLSAFLDNNPIVPLKIGLAATLIIEPVAWLEIALATVDADNQIRQAGFDTAFDGFDSLNGYVEATAHHAFESRRGDLPGNYRCGVFLDNTQRARLDDGDTSQDLERGHPGAYLSFDQVVFRERTATEEGLGFFARYGIADDDVNSIAQFWSVGMEYLGGLPGRRGDVFGLGSYQTIPSPGAGPDRTRETGVELYYRIEVLPWLVVTPDLQFVVHPGGTTQADDAVVVALRARVAL